MNDASATPQAISTSPVPRVDVDSPEEFRALVAGATEPLIGVGLARSWTAVRRWTPQYFVEHYGDTRVLAAMDLPSKGVPYELKRGEHMRTMPVREFVEMMPAADTACYIHQMSASKLPELDRDTRFDSLLPPADAEAKLYLWFGSAGTRSGLHFDRVDNLNVQVYGRKVLFLVSPDQSKLLYPFSDNVEKSQIDPDHPDFDRFPKLRRVKALRAEMGPGDVLFLPQLYWHHIRSIEPAININCWYGEQIGLGSIIRAINAGGARCWAQVARDFVACGLLGRDVGDRLFSELPTGLYLYTIVSQGIRRRLPI